MTTRTSAARQNVRPEIAAAKKKEADQRMAAGAKCLSTGLFKWSPDFEGASSEFQKAAVCYQNAKLYEQAIKAHKKAARCYMQIKVEFSAGRSLEAAAGLESELQHFEEAAKLYTKAAECYTTSSHNVVAGKTYEKAATAYKKLGGKSEQVYDVLKKAIGTYEADESEYEGVEGTYKVLIEEYLNNNRYEDAIKVNEQLIEVFRGLEQPHNIYRTFMYIVMIHLAMGDGTKAYNEFHKFSSEADFTGSPEYSATSDILDAVCSDEPDALQRFIKNRIQVIRDAVFAKMLKNQKLLGSSCHPFANLGGATSTKGTLEVYADDFEDDLNLPSLSLDTNNNNSNNHNDDAPHSPIVNIEPTKVDKKNEAPSPEASEEHEPATAENTATRAIDEISDEDLL